MITDNSKRKPLINGMRLLITEIEQVRIMQDKKLDTKLHIATERAETTAILIEVLSIIQIGLLRGQFNGMSDLEGFTQAMDKLTLKHSALLNRTRP